MPVLKRPKDAEKTLVDIKKSTTTRLDTDANISTKAISPLTKKGAFSVLTDEGKTTMASLAIAQPQTGVLGGLEKLSALNGQVVTFADSAFMKDIARTTHIISDFAKSPAFTRATEALVTTDQIADKLTLLTTPAIQRMADLSGAILEPVERLKDTVSILNKAHQFDLSIKAITETADIFSSKQLTGRTFEVEPITYRPPQTQITAIVAVLKERFDNFADEITEKVDQKFQERFDILIEQGIIPAGIKKANCHCPKCDRLLFKVIDMSHFMIGTLKCECGETLQIPRDLKIVPDN